MELEKELEQMTKQTPSIIVNGGTVNITITNDKMAAELLMKKQDAETRMRTEVNAIIKEATTNLSHVVKTFVEAKAKQQQTKKTKK